MGRRGNPYFHFQQFSIWQDRCAMKVGVDGILLGAWASTTKTHRILDIGTGTGLIALMMAQRAPQAEISAIEIDPAASQQAQENVARSPWCDRIEVKTISLQQYLTSQRFDVVISNPPFFAQTDQTDARAIARQQNTLSASIIIQAIRPHLTNHGRLAMIVPFEQNLEAIAADQELFLSRKTNIRSTPTKAFKRSLIEFSPAKTIPKIEQITIEQSRHQYSPEYKALISAFFLK